MDHKHYTHLWQCLQRADLNSKTENKSPLPSSVQVNLDWVGDVTLYAMIFTVLPCSILC